MSSFSNKEFYYFRHLVLYSHLLIIVILEYIPINIIDAEVLVLPRAVLAGLRRTRSDRMGTVIWKGLF
jgi:hypothetical protein